MSPQIPLTIFPLHRTHQEAQNGPSEAFADPDAVERDIMQCFDLFSGSPTRQVLFALDQGNVFDRNAVIKKLEEILCAENAAIDADVFYDLAP